MPSHAGRITTLALGAMLATLPAGCALGPKALEMTHGRYDEAVLRVREEEFVRNLVHVRYNESPGILNVSSIAAQYELGGTAEARPFFLSPNPSNSNVIFKTFTTILPDLSVTGSNRPTLSLDPADDAEATRQFLTPITPETMIFLFQSSWPAATIVRLYVERANGVPNVGLAGAAQRGVPVDFARFNRAADLLQICQDRELLTLHAEEISASVGEPLSAANVVEAMKSGLEVRQDANGNWRLVRKERHLMIRVTPGSENAPEIAELFGILNLEPGLANYELIFAQRGVTDPLRHPAPPSAELRIVPRSNAQVYYYLANGVEVPAEHICKGLVQPVVDEEGHTINPREFMSGLFEVHVCKGLKPPANSYVAVHYRGYWYYIDDGYTASKRTLALMLHLSRLDFARQQVGFTKPVLTLPVGR